MSFEKNKQVKFKSLNLLGGKKNKAPLKYLKKKKVVQAIIIIIIIIYFLKK